MRVLAVMFCCHFIADFLLQSREMGKTKSTDFRMLLFHLSIQFCMMRFGLLLFPSLSWLTSLKISAINALIHGVIDWNIWRGYKYSVMMRIKNKGYVQRGDWQYWEDHWFYATIGLDQLLHGLTLIGLVELFI